MNFLDWLLLIILSFCPLPLVLFLIVEIITCGKRFSGDYLSRRATSSTAVASTPDPAPKKNGDRGPRPSQSRPAMRLEKKVSRPVTVL